MLKFSIMGTPGIIDIDDNRQIEYLNLPEKKYPIFSISNTEAVILFPGNGGSVQYRQGGG
jgi:hypothetical protein